MPFTPATASSAKNAAFAAACARQGVASSARPSRPSSPFATRPRARRLAEGRRLRFWPAPTGPVDIEGAGAFQRSLPAPGAVMVKAVSGGGGRGTAPGDGHRRPGRGRASQRIRGRGRVRRRPGLRRGTARALPCNIEVQTLGDGTGAVTQLGERDCSIQRRNQKIIEVTPSPRLARHVREALLAHAVRLGESVRYAGSAPWSFSSAASASRSLRSTRACRLSTRSRKRSPASISCAPQLRLAAGATLAEHGLGQGEAPPPRRCRAAGPGQSGDHPPLRQHDAVRRHPHRARTAVRTRRAGRRRRRTSGTKPACATTLLLAKVIVHDRTAEFATLAARAHRALSECRVDGVDTNLDLLAAIVGHPAFQRGEFTTEFLDEHLEIEPVACQASALLRAASPGERRPKPKPKPKPKTVSSTCPTTPPPCAPPRPAP